MNLVLTLFALACGCHLALAAKGDVPKKTKNKIVAPNNLRVYPVDQGRVHLSWNHSMHGSPGTYYTVEACASIKTHIIRKIYANAVHISNLIIDIHYEFRVTIHTPHGDSHAATLMRMIHNGTTGDNLEEATNKNPCAPRHIHVSKVTKTSCRLSWVKPKHSGSSEVTYYIVTKIRLDNGEADVVDAHVTELFIEIKGLVPLKDYKFLVGACNKDKLCSKMSSLLIRHSTPLGAPSGSSPTPVPNPPGDHGSPPVHLRMVIVEKTVVRFEWSRPVDIAVGIKITYIVKKKKLEEGSFIDVGTTEDKKMLIRDLVVKTNYEFCVSAQTEDGPPSDCITMVLIFANRQSGAPTAVPEGVSGATTDGAEGASGAPTAVPEGVSGATPAGAEGASGPPMPGAEGASGAPTAVPEGVSGASPAGAEGASGPPMPGDEGASGTPTAVPEGVSGASPAGAEDVSGAPTTGPETVSGATPDGAKGASGPPMPGAEGASGAPTAVPEGVSGASPATTGATTAGHGEPGTQCSSGGDSEAPCADGTPQPPEIDGAPCSGGGDSDAPCANGVPGKPEIDGAYEYPSSEYKDLGPENGEPGPNYGKNRGPPQEYPQQIKTYEPECEYDCFEDRGGQEVGRGSMDTRYEVPLQRESPEYSYGGPVQPGYPPPPNEYSYGGPAVQPGYPPPPNEYSAYG